MMDGYSVEAGLIISRSLLYVHSTREVSTVVVLYNIIKKASIFPELNESLISFVKEWPSKLLSHLLVS